MKSGQGPFEEAKTPFARAQCATSPAPTSHYPGAGRASPTRSCNSRAKTPFPYGIEGEGRPTLEGLLPLLPRPGASRPKRMTPEGPCFPKGSTGPARKSRFAAKRRPYGVSEAA